MDALYIFALVFVIMLAVIAAVYMYRKVNPAPQESFKPSPWSYESNEPEIVQAYPISKRETLLVRTRHGQYRTEMLNSECAAARLAGFNPN